MKTISFVILILVINQSIYSQKLTKSLDSLMNNYVSEGKLHGCVTYVQQHNKVEHFKSYGHKNIEENEEMHKEVIFAIASMTKIVTAAGALKLYEQGKFLLDDPVQKYLPQFEYIKVMEHIGTDSMKLVKPQRDITIRDLFRHTSGIGYPPDKMQIKDTIDKMYTDAQFSQISSSEEFLDKICEIPLWFHPGSAWKYGYSNDILGMLIEKIS
ncbi:MAG: beta-lactamase family protein, partial [Bacteroidales bacterium]|nr:beta-lactamase family protein [Bacteroidales bacterium]